LEARVVAEGVVFRSYVEKSQKKLVLLVGFMDDQANLSSEARRPGIGRNDRGFGQKTHLLLHCPALIFLCLAETRRDKSFL
jgi:hypothetical protein